MTNQQKKKNRNRFKRTSDFGNIEYRILNSYLDDVFCKHKGQKWLRNMELQKDQVDLKKMS